ncbi:MAG: SUMF1/EgtB/PvdO family nonheme iron enzyme [Spirochaetales bacterium]|nr:SUMF1/EgtB/PvdO family nonheme iron enzyme [Spirochaetales bacterium]
MKTTPKNICISFLIICIAVFLASCQSKQFFREPDQEMSVGDVTFKMKFLPKMDFPGGPPGTTGPPEKRPDIIRVAGDYWLAETYTTYELWKTVYDWAVSNGYLFDRPGQMGTESGSPDMNSQHPVTLVDWTSAAVWCNALTEFYNLENNMQLKQVYLHDGEVLKIPVPRKDENSIIADTQAGGFRLPTGYEWEMAARYSDEAKDDTYTEYPKNSGRFWATFYSVSGEPEYREDRGDIGGNVEYGSITSRPAQELDRNDLGFSGFAGKDGKMWQWCYEFLLYRDNSGDSFSLKRGGSRAPRCGRHEYWPRNREIDDHETCSGYDQITFRVARNAG